MLVEDFLYVRKVWCSWRIKVIEIDEKELGMGIKAILETERLRMLRGCNAPFLRMWRGQASLSSPLNICKRCVPSRGKFSRAARTPQRRRREVVGERNMNSFRRGKCAEGYIDLKLV
jgi:hypothetical protein